MLKIVDHSIVGCYNTFMDYKKGTNPNSSFSDFIKNLQGERSFKSDVMYGLISKVFKAFQRENPEVKKINEAALKAFVDGLRSKSDQKTKKATTASEK